MPNCRFLDTFFDAHSSFQSIFHLHAVHVKKEEEESVRFKITIFKCTKIQFFCGATSTLLLCTTHVIGFNRDLEKTVSEGVFKFLSL